MAAYDIMPVSNPHGQHERVHHFQVGTAGFVVGEPVVLAAAGTIAEASSPVDAATEWLGIALGPVSYRKIGSDAGGAGASTPSGTVVTENFRTGADYAAGDSVPVLCPDDATLFMTQNLYDGSDTLVVPTLANIGDEIGYRQTAGGVWGVDIAEAVVGNIVDVLDADKHSLAIEGSVGAGVWVVFKCVASQWQTVTGL